MLYSVNAARTELNRRKVFVVFPVNWGKAFPATRVSRNHNRINGVVGRIRSGRIVLNCAARARAAMCAYGGIRQ